MNNFQLNDDFKNDVKNKKNRDIVSLFAVLINTDRDFSKGKADAGIEYIKEHYPDFIKPDIGEEFKPEYEWTEDYWTEISVSLRHYFSLEKIEQLRKMSKKLYPIQDTSSQNINNGYSSKKQNTTLVMAVVTGVVVVATAVIIYILNIKE